MRFTGGWLRGGSVDKLSRIAWLYIGAAVAAAVIVVVKGPYAGLDWGQIGVLGLLLVACESTATLLNARGLAWSANTMASLAAVVLCGPVGAALVSCGTLLGIRRGPSIVQRLFNTAMYVLSAYLAGRTFLAFGGPVGTPGQSSFPGLIGPFAAAAVVHVAVNFMLLHGVFWLTREPGSATTRIGLEFNVWLVLLG